MRCRPAAGWSPAATGHGRTTPAEMTDDSVQPAPFDPLHGVIAQAANLTDVEHRHDVRVMQTGRRAGFVQEPPSGR